jgi:predicted RND superfamily exporter protein
VAFVIVVDDTIHFLHKYLWERKKGSTIHNALRVTINQCGTAILATSIVLVGAFFILMFSSLEEIVAFGLLTAVIVIVAFFMDMMLLPILIRNGAWGKRKK